MSWFDWTIQGAEGLAIRGTTDRPEGSAKGVAIVVHGFTGSLRRNIIPVVGRGLAEMGWVAHRFTMSHAGVGEDGDSITDLDTFQRDSLEHCLTDIRAVIRSVRAGELGGEGLPMVLVGHSRGGAQVLGLAGRMCARMDCPAGVVSLAATATYTRFDESMRAELEERGYVEKDCGRAPGGKVRLGRSWYEQHLDYPGRDLYAEDLARVTCPVLVVHSEHDDGVPFEHGARNVGLLSSIEAETCFLDAGDHNFDAHELDGFSPEPGSASRRVLDAIWAFLKSVGG